MSRRAKTTFSKFDVAHYLDNQNVVAEYPPATAQDETCAVLLMAPADAAKMRDIGIDGQKAVAEEMRSI